MDISVLYFEFRLLWNHFNSWGSMFVGNQHSGGSWGRNFVGNQYIMRSWIYLYRYKK
jgi:hypothetical protein